MKHDKQNCLRKGCPYCDTHHFEPVVEKPYFFRLSDFCKNCHKPKYTYRTHSCLLKDRFYSKSGADIEKPYQDEKNKILNTIFSNKERDWEKGFWESFGYLLRNSTLEDTQMLENYINTLLLSERQRMVEEIMKVPHATREDVWREEAFLINRDDILSALKE